MAAGPHALAQEKAPADGQTSAKTSAPKSTADQNEPPADNGAQLADFRHAIVSEAKALEERRAVAELLLKSPIPGADAVVAEILRDGGNRLAQAAICQAAAEVGMENQQLLGAVLVDPLIELLRAPDESLQVQAAEALAVFPDGDVAQRLGAVAADGTACESTRLAAIGALAANLHRCEVVEQLIGLLDDPTPGVVERVLVVLAPAARQPLGDDPAKWKQWWEGKRSLDETAWLDDRIRMLSDRVRDLTADQQSRQAATKQREADLAKGIAEFQRDTFRRLPTDQQDAKLVEWLGDPIAVVRRTAIELIMQGLSDEGRRPVDAVRAALTKRLDDPLPAVRREALEIVGAIADPADAPAVLALLAAKPDARTRQAVFDALGKLRNPAAIPALVQEISNEAAQIECVRAASFALARLAGLSNPLSPDALATTVEPLKTRLAALPAEDATTRSALLTAMAEIADPSFAGEFSDQLTSSDPIVLRPAIRGLTAVGDASSLPVVRALLSESPDALVRQRAAEMVGKIGREDIDLEALARRAKRATESDAAVRNAAWKGFLTATSTRSPQQRLVTAQHLRDDQALEEAFLTSLVSSLAQSGADGSVLESARNRLADVLMSQQKYPEAISHLRALYDALKARNDAQAVAAGVRLFHAAIHAHAHDILPEIVTNLAAGGDQTVIDGLVDEIRAYLDSPAATEQPQRTTALLEKLRSIPAEGLGEKWSQLVLPPPGEADSGDKPDDANAKPQPQTSPEEDPPPGDDPPTPKPAPEEPGGQAQQDPP